MLDIYTFVIAYIVKAYRISVLWFVMYLVEKMYLDRYISRVFIKDKKPVGLLSYIWVCISIENIAFLALFLVLYLMMERFKGPTNAFAIDAKMLKALLVDYVFSTVMIVSIGASVAQIVQNDNLFRFSYDGLRGIRACGDLLAQISVIVLVIPFFLVAS